MEGLQSGQPIESKLLPNFIPVLFIELHFLSEHIICLWLFTYGLWLFTSLNSQFSMACPALDGPFLSKTIHCFPVFNQFLSILNSP